MHIVRGAYSRAPPSTPTRPDWPLCKVPFNGGMIALIWLNICFGTGILPVMFLDCEGEGVELSVKRG